MLSEAGAKEIAYTVLFLEPQQNPGADFLRELEERLTRSGLAVLPDMSEGLNARLSQLKQDIKKLQQQSAANQDADFDQTVLDELPNLLSQSWGPGVDAILNSLEKAQSSMDADAVLATAVASSGRVLLAEPFMLGEPMGNMDAELPSYITRSTIDFGATPAAASKLPLQAYGIIPPIQMVGDFAQGIGHLNSKPDVDGAVRTEPLVLKYYDHYFPSLALLTAAYSLNIDPQEIKILPGRGVKMGRLNILTDPALQMNTFFYSTPDGSSAFPISSFYDVVSGRIPASRFKDKIVLVGSSATGIGSPQVTPIDPVTPPVVTLAHSISSILSEDFFIEPDWGKPVRIIIFVLLAAYIVLLMPRFRAGPAALVTVLLLAALGGAHFYLMTNSATWLQLATPAAMLFFGHILITTKRFLVTEESKLRTEADSVESNKMLALQFQAQGQLDMALEKFLRCPLDNKLMGLLYNLGLDFERKRHFAKARSVYEHMLEFDPNYKDIKTRITQARDMEATVILGGGSGPSGGTVILGSSGVEKPKLGRYNVESELGRGAMGVVYLGRDPKIGREVAIKTLALSAEFEGQELDDAKQRFFREAESAGRLNHPHIVTIYDAGEEHDLAYIAMEFLKGQELTRYTKPDTLLPVVTVLKILLSAADALGYAHRHNVIHRDIKPANIMYDRTTGEVKLTDFGIARITDSSQTKTGVVLGTPSYMSPEQLSGKKVDGRSDLFSLGAMGYLLLTGKRPFHSDSMATLMHQIVNQNHVDVLELRPDLPPCIGPVINKALEKDREQRYQTGNEMAMDLRMCIEMAV
jgi:serine/threonine-protein kinase